jgi:hypothetical protein
MKPDDDKRPMPGDEYEKHPIPSSTGDKSYRETGTRPFTIKLRPEDEAKEAVPRQPNDRDESPDSQASGPREIIEQAYKDVMQGQVDTDLREQRGVEEAVDVPLKPAPGMPQKKQDRS